MSGHDPNATSITITRVTTGGAAGEVGTPGNTGDLLIKNGPKDTDFSWASPDGLLFAPPYNPAAGDTPNTGQLRSFSPLTISQTLDAVLSTVAVNSYSSGPFRISPAPVPESGFLPDQDLVNVDISDPALPVLIRSTIGDAMVAADIKRTSPVVRNMYRLPNEGSNSGVGPYTPENPYRYTAYVNVTLPTYLSSDSTYIGTRSIVAVSQDSCREDPLFIVEGRAWPGHNEFLAVIDSRSSKLSTYGRGVSIMGVTIPFLVHIPGETTEAAAWDLVQERLNSGLPVKVVLDQDVQLPRISLQLDKTATLSIDTAGFKLYRTGFSSTTPANAQKASILLNGGVLEFTGGGEISSEVSTRVSGGVPIILPPLVQVVSSGTVFADGVIFSVINPDNASDPVKSQGIVSIGAVTPDALAIAAPGAHLQAIFENVTFAYSVTESITPIAIAPVVTLEDLTHFNSNPSDAPIDLPRSRRSYGLRGCTFTPSSRWAY